MSDQSKILIIEDDAYLRELYTDILKTQGYEVVTAVDGEEGLKKAQGGGYKLILLDMMLPKKDGIQILKELKNNPPKISNDKIVLMTNLSHEDVIKEGLELGASSYLIKSQLTPNVFLDDVKVYLGSL